MTDADIEAARSMVAGKLRRLGVEDDFLSTLLNQTDWALAVQCAALLEAAVSDTVALYVRDKEIERAISSAPYSRRVEILRSIGPRSSAETRQGVGQLVRSILAIAQVRNEFVHKVSNISREMIDVVRGLGPTVERSITDHGTAAGSNLQIRLRFWIGTVVALSRLEAFDRRRYSSSDRPH